MRKIFTFILALVASAGTLFADKVKIGDLYYNLNTEDKTAEVTYENNNGGGSSNYSRLTKIVVPSSVTYNSVPYNVTSIGSQAFFGCNNLTSVVLPNSLLEIRQVAFNGCPLLQTINIPANVQMIEMLAFVLGDWDATEEKPISNFKSFIVDENNQYFTAKDGVLFNKAMTRLIQFPSGKSETEYIVPNTVESIAQYAFYYVMDVTKVTVPDNVQHVGEFAFGYNFGIDSIIIGNGVERIPYSCFAESGSLQYVSLGTSVKEIANTALGEEQSSLVSFLPLSTIVCYSQQVPEIIKADSINDEGNTFYYSSYKDEDAEDVFLGINRNTKLYVQGDLISDYKKHFVWGEFDVQPITAESAETTDVKTTTTENSVDVTWPAVTNAYTYELVIRDKSGNVICTLIFNSAGQLTSIAFAPARGEAPQKEQTAGFSFTITGLDAGTFYDLTITAKNEAGQELDKKNVSFHTDSAEGIEDIHVGSDKPVKALMDGQIYILRGEHVYDTQGKMVR